MSSLTLGLVKIDLFSLRSSFCCPFIVVPAFGLSLLRCLGLILMSFMIIQALGPITFILSMVYNNRRPLFTLFLSTG